jgi:predicted RNA-binding Zn ribbon-like protein
MAEPAAAPQALIVLANLGRPRRPTGAAVAHTEPVLPDLTGAATQLASIIDRPIAEADLAGLRRLQRTAVDVTEAIVADETVDCDEINALAAGGTARVTLVVAEGVLRQQLVWTDTSSAAALARRVIEELSALEPDRLRRCARPECDLLFYDSTRSRTRRWHAEDPCGWRERQRIHRTRPLTDR